MAQISIIKKSELKGAVRIDSEYYKPEYLKKDKILKQVNCKNLEDISKSIINFGAYSLCSQIEYLSKGVPFLQVDNIKEIEILKLEKATQYGQTNIPYKE